MLKPALMFKDNAVLQRDKVIAVWGDADPGANITVTVQGKTAFGAAGHDGKWRVKIGPLETSFDETLEIKSEHDAVSCSHVMVGDVWFAGGQSNMEYHMAYDADLEAEKERCENPYIRFFDYPEVHFPGQIDMADYGKNYGFWRSCDAENLERFSAVAYYCAKDLQAKYHVPVGILACNYGGTPIMAWVSEEVSLQNGNRHKVEAYYKQLENLDLEAYDKRFMSDPGSFITDELAPNPLNDLLKTVTSIEELMRALGVDPSAAKPEDLATPVGPKSQLRPAGLYESMLLPCVPYGIRGFLWYQGCSDADAEADARAYGQMLPALIRHWRMLWEDEALPFLLVQLAPLKDWLGVIFGTYYPIVREAQQKTADTVPNTAMAVITDGGMEHDLHPKKKQPVGHRLALLAEHYVYGEKDVLCEAPTLIGVEAEAGKATLTFDHAGTGLYLAETVPGGQFVGDEHLGGLRLFQGDKELDLSDATAIAEDDHVTVICGAIQAGLPTRASFAETAWYLVNLYNSAGIPARPAHV